MTTVKLRYVVKRRGCLFWQPTKAMRALGFEAKPLGTDGPAAHAEASRLYQTWLSAKAKAVRITDYPPGTLGAYYDRLKKKSRAFQKKQARTRDDYERAWVHLDPVFGRMLITAITADQVEDFVDDGLGGGIAHTLSASERYRTLKCLRALLADAILRLKLTIPNVARAVANPQAPGRSQIWLGSEIDKLVSGAAEVGLPGMSVAIRIAWDSLFSPIDVWSLARGRIHKDVSGWYIERERTKTSKAAFGALSDTTAEALMAYIEGLGFTLAADSPVIRQRNGHAYSSKDTFGDHFREVRAHVFGPDEKRQFMDIRRSGNVEADAAGADKETMGELLANGLATNRFLDETYTPPTVAKARQVAVQRLAGRKALAAELERVSRRRLKAVE